MDVDICSFSFIALIGSQNKILSRGSLIDEKVQEAPQAYETHFAQVTSRHMPTVAFILERKKDCVSVL